ncbi:MAG: PQQ-binding-like beta-propeller repeat protein [Verrucomicrobia bacterium]|nr:PQQ-binding-like beta-propeller repeat protein [Verrucomicrobiota bacterium]
MDPQNIVLLGVKGTVLAFQKDTGKQLWATHLKSNGFVTTIADDLLVYAHTGGELFCLDLQTGTGLWQNNLPGLGYDVASLALPNQPPPSDAMQEKLRRDQSDAAAATSTSA